VPASTEVHLIRRPSGEPAAADFALRVTEVPNTPAPGQLVVRNDWFSVDPYMRGRMDNTDSYVAPFALDAPLDGAAVGTVIASGAPAIPVGAQIVHDLGWREYAVVDAAAVRTIDATAAPAHAYLGTLGGPGLTAYVGLTRIAPVRRGDVVFISGAAGAVGLSAVTVARKMGAAKVIGSAGGPHKVERLLAEFGVDTAIDYRLGRLDEQLADAAPAGVDVYFDNVGGDHLQAALSNMRDHGRIALCGAISQYNLSTPPPGPANLILAVTRRLTLRGFIVTDHWDLLDDFISEATQWIRNGDLTTEHTAVDGIENAVDAFRGLLSGANTGKMLVRL
jgi:NADPH-dependent curcumin reductase CurA